jgi:putative SOS response-associated peptidase YedK
MPGCPAPYPEGLMTAYPVSTAVSAVGNDGPELVRPLAAS